MCELSCIRFEYQLVLLPHQISNHCLGMNYVFGDYYYFFYPGWMICFYATTLSFKYYLSTKCDTYQRAAGCCQQTQHILSNFSANQPASWWVGTMENVCKCSMFTCSQKLVVFSFSKFSFQLLSWISFDHFSTITTIDHNTWLSGQLVKFQEIWLWGNYCITDMSKIVCNICHLISLVCTFYQILCVLAFVLATCWVGIFNILENKKHTNNTFTQKSVTFYVAEAHMDECSPLYFLTNLESSRHSIYWM